ncbi:hypothetical protein RLO149_c020200 [Roseobacter litoralis Och 149]|uniref:Uncharacterized protein n=1 Tax=Roseobacter litoralis (strain ATCC 49566 / DSM 6996 / JCM 21268 / NBRC 15278 / OCh 149) TaxID=391595 RepID=F7ZKZ2_ROSLO|nr:hypothetical protein RLO149_c020200 [Roseobacter litoralis Och 149]
MLSAQKTTSKAQLETIKTFFAALMVAAPYCRKSPVTRRER